MTGYVGNDTSLKNVNDAVAARLATEAVYNNFDDRYLGTKAVAPTLDNNGQPLLLGALYFDSTENMLKVYDGSVWVNSISIINTITAKYVYTATANQTVFTGADDNLATMVIDNNSSALVYLNGVILIPNTDYTIVSGANSNASITLTTGASAGNTLLVVTFNYLNNVAVDAGMVANTPAGNITSLNVQAAVNELDTIKSDKPVVSYLSKSGHNSQAILLDGKLYTASGNASNYWSKTSGRHNNSPSEYGVLNSFRNVNIPDISPIKKVGGFMHSYAFALLENGNLYTWGHNLHGQCGLGHTTSTPHPTLAAIGVLDAFDHPSQGEYTVNGNRLFILKSDGLYATGYNNFGQCGLGNTTGNILSFTKCVGLTNTLNTDIKKVYPIGCDYGSTWVLTSDNRLWVTGRNNTGNHGDGTTTDKSTFTDVTSNWVTAGKILADIKVVGASRYYDVADNGSHGVMLILLTYTDGTNEVKGAGFNAWGSLGNGNTTQQTVPVSPIGIPTDGSVVDIQGFGGSPLVVHVLLSNGNVYGWGHNAEGEVGDGTSGNNHITPSLITTGVTKLFSDGMNSNLYGYNVQNFMQKADGLYMNGQNDTSYYAGMGVNNTSNVLTPTKVLLPEYDNQVVDIGHFTTNASGRITLMLTNKNNIYAWGYNGNNGLTSDSTVNIAIPTLVNLPKRNP